MKRRIHVAIGSKNPCKIDSVKSAFHKVFERHLSQHPTATPKEGREEEEEDYELVFTSYNVPSNVNDQPIGDDETLTGAKNRALAAFEAARREYDEKATATRNVNEEGDDGGDYAKDCCIGAPDFGIGLEGGIEIKTTHDKEDGGDKELWCMAWMAIVGTNSTACTLAKHESSKFTEAIIDTKSDDRDSQQTDLKWGLSKTAAFQLPKRISHLILHENVELGKADDIVFNRVNSKQGSGTVGILTNHIITRSEYYDHAIVLALVSFIWPEHYS